jgi:uncharacterized protein (DUF736 family)
MEEKSIGALWSQEGKKSGTKYLSGNITINGVTTPIIVFTNNYKEGKQPDYKIYEKKPRNQQETNQPVPLEDPKLEPF